MIVNNVFKQIWSWRKKAVQQQLFYIVKYIYNNND